MSMKEENEKVGFKLNMKETNLGTWPHHFMANRSGNNRSSGRFLLLGGFKITADADCSHKSKRHLYLGKKAMRNTESISKSRDITLQTKAI